MYALKWYHYNDFTPRQVDNLRYKSFHILIFKQVCIQSGGLYEIESSNIYDFEKA